MSAGSSRAPGDAPPGEQNKGRQGVKICCSRGIHASLETEERRDDTLQQSPKDRVSYSIGDFIFLGADRALFLVSKVLEKRCSDDADSEGLKL